MIVQSNHPIGKYMVNWRWVRWLTFLDRRLQMAHVYAIKCRYFNNQPSLVKKYTQRHRNQIDIFNYHKPWFFRRREYAL